MSSILALIKNNLAGIYPPGEIRALARLLLEKHFQISMIDIYADKVRDFSSEEMSDLENILERMRVHEPIQYILGEADFDNRSFFVAPGVLIPRPETAELVTWITEEYHAETNNHVCHLLDAGTGSGCIAISLAVRLPHINITAWDISEDALQIAIHNAQHHQTNICFEKKDILKEVLHPASAEKSFHIIVSNPPYICYREKETMERNVLDHEPELALFVPDDDPLRFYRALALLGKKRLAPNGKIYMEINREMGEPIINLFQKEGYQNIELRKDCNENNRMIRCNL